MNIKSLKFWLCFLLVISIFVIGIISINAYTSTTEGNTEIEISSAPEVIDTLLNTDIVTETPTNITTETATITSTDTPTLQPTETPLVTETALPTATSTDFDDTLLEDVTLSNGFSPLQEGGFIVTIGTSVKTDFEKNILSITGSQLKDLISTEKNIFSKEEINFLKENEFYKNEKLAPFLIREMFSKVFRDSNENWSKESTNITLSSENEKQKNFLKSIYELQQHDFTLKGTVSFTGNTVIPRKVYCFIGASYIKFNDGKKIRIINTHLPYVMDSSGDSSYTKVSDESTITVISNLMLEN